MTRPSNVSEELWRTAVMDCAWIRREMPGERVCCPVEMLPYEVAEGVSVAEHRAVQSAQVPMRPHTARTLGFHW